MKKQKEKKPKLFIMGEEVDWDSQPDSPAQIEDYFAEVTISTHAIDRASQVVPEKVWQTTGIYTWLHRRANQAFQAMPASHRQFTIGKLKYVFEYEAEGPVLKTVILTQPA